MQRHIFQAVTTFTLAVCFSSIVFAGETLKVRIPKTVGVMNVKIIAASKPTQIRQLKNATTLKVFYVAQWGLHNFEYGALSYQCNSKNSCEVTGEPKRIAFYERCMGLTAAGKPLCDGLKSSDDVAMEDTRSNDLSLECELNPQACSRSNDIDGTSDPVYPTEETLF